MRTSALRENTSVTKCVQIPLDPTHAPVTAPPPSTLTASAAMVHHELFDHFKLPVAAIGHDCNILGCPLVTRLTDMKTSVY